jgi:hypothetical protein
LEKFSDRIQNERQTIQEVPDFIGQMLAGDAVLIAPVSTQIPCYTATP